METENKDLNLSTPAAEAVPPPAPKRRGRPPKKRVEETAAVPPAESVSTAIPAPAAEPAPLGVAVARGKQHHPVEHARLVVARVPALGAPHADC